LRLEKAVAFSLAVHLLVSGAIAIGQGIKRRPAPPPVFAELVPPPPEAHRAPERLAEERQDAREPETPPATEKTAAYAPAGTPEAPPADAHPGPPQPAPPAEAAPAPAQPPAPVASASPDAATPGLPSDNVARSAMPIPLDLGKMERAQLHRLAVASTESFSLNAPRELSRIVSESLAGGALMAQGDALIHMDVTPMGQVGQAHLQANSQALYNRLGRVDWTTALPPRPLAGFSAIHLRITVVGNDIRVNVELL
jgi:hypothetical protein